MKIKIEIQELICKEIKFENKRMKIKYKKYGIRNEKKILKDEKNLWIII